MSITGAMNTAKSASVLIAAALCSGCFATSSSTDPGPAQPSIETVKEQEVLTPVPVRVRLPARLGADTVALRFRTRGSNEWSTEELFRSGQTWRGEVPCLEVSTITGELQYYLTAHDSQGRVIATSGTRAWPHVTNIVQRLPTGPQSLPGEPRQWRCPDPADCPPGFPGCPDQSLRRPECTSDRDCPGGYCAWDGYCATPENPS